MVVAVAGPAGRTPVCARSRAVRGIVGRAGSDGLPEVCASFPARAASLGIGRCVREAKRRRGPRAVPAFGLLADDLSKLIDLYGDWSRRLLPGLPSLAARIDVLEAAGKASALKLELRGVRYNALKVLGEKEGGGEGGEGEEEGGTVWGEEEGGSAGNHHGPSSHIQRLKGASRGTVRRSRSPRRSCCPGRPLNTCPCPPCLGRVR